MTVQQIISRRKELWEENNDIEQDKLYREAVANEIIKDTSLIKVISENPEYLIEMVFVIVDKDKNTRPFFLNTVQRMFIDRLNKAIEDYKNGLRLSLKFLVLKGRQQGFTSFITAYQLACTITNKNFEGFTAADEDGNASTIFQNKAKYTYGLLPLPLKPTEKFNNRKQLLFDKINSSWEVRTVSANMGRSRTLKFFHGSEAAFWKVLISDVQAGIGEALTKDSIQILESTANGYNEYKDLWDSGKWECCFYEWWHTEEYSTNLGANKDSFMDNVKSKKEWIYKRCRWLLSDIKLTWEQVYWYHNKWASYIRGDLIKQEYPCTPEEAFLASGSCVFNTEVLMSRIDYLRRNNPLVKTGYFAFDWDSEKTKGKIIDDTIHFVESKTKPWIRMYEDKKEYTPYVIGGDTKGEGSDFYAATTINNVTGKRASTIHMQISNSKPYTWQLYCLGKYYNNALIGIEINFNTAPIEELERLQYPNQYMRQKYDDLTKGYMPKLGWKTDGNTRPLIIDKEIDLIENNIDLFTDIDMLGESMTFVYDKNGRPDAMSGKHDDLLISDMIANEIRPQQSFEAKAEEYDIDWSKVPSDYLEDFESGSDSIKQLMLDRWRKMGLYKAR
jgi:hypothetical protein